MSIQDPWDSESGVPNIVTRSLLERDVQSKCVDWARDRGWWARKFSSPANRSVPDYLFARTWGGGARIKIAVEFKAPGKTSTSAQLKEQDAMRAAGWQVYEIDNIARFKALFHCSA